MGSILMTLVVEGKMLSQLPGLVIALVVLALAFGIVERRWPAIREKPLLRRGIVTDLEYYALTPTVGKLFTAVVVFACVASLAAIFGIASLSPEHIRHLDHRDTTVGRWSPALQLAVFIVLADILGYWSHRAFHQVGQLWKFHAIHHSSTELDWLSSVRVHPVNDAAQHVVTAVPLLLLGFSPGVVAAYVPFLTLYAIMLHANVTWSFGPLRYVIASPTFHRWHHTTEQEGIDKNFAGLFPWIDWAFGTLYFPKGVQPTRFGVLGTKVPESLLAQLAYPFRKRRKKAAARTASPA